MRFLVRTHLAYTAEQPCDLLLQIEACADDVQRLESVQLTLDPGSHSREVSGEDGIGVRRWIQPGPQFTCNYEALVDVTRRGGAIDALAQTPRSEIPGDVVKYLMPSRYCHSDLFLDFVSGQFGDLQGGALIAAMRDWITSNFTYNNEISNAATTATDSFNSLSGVCRDYAHVLITFARAAGIPARFVSVYGPNVTPQDFHAVAEVYLEGGWHLVDATGMAKASETIRICVGRDAADASFMTSYGWMNLLTQTVEVRKVAS